MPEWTNMFRSVKNKVGSALSSAKRAAITAKNVFRDFGSDVMQYGATAVLVVEDMARAYRNRNSESLVVAGSEFL